MRALVGCSERR